MHSFIGATAKHANPAFATLHDMTVAAQYECWVHYSAGSAYPSCINLQLLVFVTELHERNLMLLDSNDTLKHLSLKVAGVAPMPCMCHKT